ncbi:MAG TPA: hypothetical protein PKN76_04395 [bacterium]|jgi:DNA repair protein RecN (Recombination protein N)|nr:hypothetical protein [bacterium]
MKIVSVFLKNFLIIKKSEIELSGGLTTVTGETGSGKSLFVSAMKALRGERIGRSFLGRWGDTGEVTAEIALEECDSDIKKGLQSGGIDLEEGEPLVLRRLFGEKNGSYINDSPVSASFLNEIFSDHIEIGSQFENRELFKKDYRMRIVDLKADNMKKLAEYRAIFEKISECRHEMAAFVKKDDPARREYLEYQISELEALQTYEGEDEKLQSRMKFIENRAKIIKLGSELSEFIENSSKDLAKCDTIASQLEKLIDIKELSERISAASIETDDISRSVSAHLSKYDEDDENVEDVEKRFNLLSALMIKHGVQSSAGLVEKMNSMSDELFDMDKVPQKIKELEKELQTLIKKGMEKALQLRTGREKAARKIEENILKYLDRFGMSGVRFSVSLNYIKDLNETGLDEVEFSVNTIGTEKMFDISSLSGGELSRLLLAVKLVDDEEGRVLLFDEIDSSIGGETAKSAAGEMKKNSEKNQIIVVTHFPQTAAVAHRHILVEKSVTDGEITAGIKDLGHDEKIKELARMMGDSDSSVFLKTAEKMIGG